MAKIHTWLAGTIPESSGACVEHVELEDMLPVLLAVSELRLQGLWLMFIKVRQQALYCSTLNQEPNHQYMEIFH